MSVIPLCVEVLIVLFGYVIGELAMVAVLFEIVEILFKPEPLSGSAVGAVRGDV